MPLQTTLILVLIGLIAGFLSGFVGVGGGIVIVPALVYFLGFSQHTAQGTSLFILLLPVGFLAVMNYYKTANINWKFGLIIAVCFVFGGYIGSKLAIKISPSLVRIIFGLVMAYISILMIFSGYNSFISNES